MVVAPGDDGGVDLTWTVDGRRYVASLSDDEMPAAQEALDRTVTKSERDGLVPSRPQRRVRRSDRA
jgi:hypothetical protein